MSPRTAWLSRPSLLRTVVSQARLAWRLLRDPSVPIAAKALPVLGALYVVSPLDVVPDPLPILGQIDDLTFLLLVVRAFVMACPRKVADFHRNAIACATPYSPI